ncbi:Gfo/Idh/MocA family protein [Rhodohalobacter barkolensis]|nr:Gfo/Idh/MocA family oxidoreductase [Rhodohalobacter barkolensis]
MKKKVKGKKGFKKVFRYWSVYGLSRTLNKVSGRLRSFNIFKPKFLSRNPVIGLIGCGQFQFSTIAYFLSKGKKNRFLFCYDIDEKKAESLGKYYKVPAVVREQEEVYNQSGTDLVYIASNHASHTTYALKFLEKDINVYCEKPVSVTFTQFESLIKSINKSNGSFYAGYNRPYSQAVQKIKQRVKEKNNTVGKFSLNCFISAHDIPEDHWYRNPEEGTRICGNVGHWLDLMIHMYNWRGYIPKAFKVQIAYSNTKEPDDNITISITTPEGDITSITITARSEPFEGINETINFQYDTIIAKIDDFRRLTIWDEEKLYKKKYRPKDVGHKRSVMQPFEKDNRDLNEVIASTELMLHITEMVRNTVTEKEIELTRSL